MARQINWIKFTDSTEVRIGGKHDIKKLMLISYDDNGRIYHDSLHLQIGNRNVGVWAEVSNRCTMGGRSSLIWPNYHWLSFIFNDSHYCYGWFKPQHDTRNIMWSGRLKEKPGRLSSTPEHAIYCSGLPQITLGERDHLFSLLGKSWTGI